MLKAFFSLTHVKIYLISYQRPNKAPRIIMESRNDSAHSELHRSLLSAAWADYRGRGLLVKSKIWTYNNLMLNVWLSNESQCHIHLRTTSNYYLTLQNPSKTFFCSDRSPRRDNVGSVYVCVYLMHSSFVKAFKQ